VLAPGHRPADVPRRPGAAGAVDGRRLRHRAFAEAYDLQFPLLVDDLGEVAEAYGVLHDEIDGHSRLAKRALFLVDADRRVGYAWATEDPAEQPDLDAVRTVLDRERHGGNGNGNGNGNG